MGIVKPFYKVIVPKAEGKFEIQWDNCFNELADILQNQENRPFRISIFIHTIDEADYKFKSDLIRNSIYRLVNGSLLPINIIPQSPEEPYNVVIELGMLSEKEGLVQYYSVDGINYSTITSDEFLECWVVGAQLSGNGDNKYEAADGSFRKLKLVLDNLDLDFDSIVRQWNYVGEILDLSYANGRTMQNYQIFNEVRNSYYTQYRKCSSFPAATGIGMNSTHVGIECYAIGNSSNVQIIPISNPKQEESYQYGQDVLVGDAIVHKQAPQFERAILLKSGASSRLIISGTAAIIGQKTIGIGDVVQQTKTTIDNIETLVSRTNLMNHYSNNEQYPDKYSYLRVYVKYRSDITKVRQICTEKYGDVPMTFVQADICRDNLLVEIEAEKMNV